MEKKKVTLNDALELAKSGASQVWDDILLKLVCSAVTGTVVGASKGSFYLGLVAAALQTVAVYHIQSKFIKKKATSVHMELKEGYDQLTESFKILGQYFGQTTEQVRNTVANVFGKGAFAGMGLKKGQGKGHEPKQVG